MKDSRTDADADAISKCRGRGEKRGGGVNYDKESRVMMVETIANRVRVKGGRVVAYIIV